MSSDIFLRNPLAHQKPTWRLKWDKGPDAKRFSKHFSNDKSRPEWQLSDKFENHQAGGAHMKQKRVKDEAHVRHCVVVSWDVGRCRSRTNWGRRKWGGINAIKNKQTNTKSGNWYTWVGELWAIHRNIQKFETWQNSYLVFKPAKK